MALAPAGSRRRHRSRSIVTLQELAEDPVLPQQIRRRTETCNLLADEVERLIQEDLRAEAKNCATLQLFKFQKQDELMTAEARLLICKKREDDLKAQLKSAEDASRMAQQDRDLCRQSAERATLHYWLYRQLHLWLQDEMMR